MRRLLVGCLVAAAAPFAPSSADVSLSIVGPGASKDDPALGTVVQLNVSCGAAACPPWVRVDRLDGVADSTPFVRLVDEGYTFTWAPTFPHFFEPGWGIHSFPFGGSSDGKPISIVASGLSAKYNGTALTKNSSALTIYYSTAFEGSKSSMAIEDLGPGSVRLTLKNTAAPAFDTVRFDRYFPSNLTASPPQFAVDFFFNQHSGTGSIVRTFQEPGVYYWGVTPTFQGRAGGATAGGVFASCGGQKFAGPPTDCQPTTHPVALVVKGPNGEDGNQTAPPGFAGTVHHLKPLKTKHQFCIFERNLTVFNGVQVRVPLCRPGKSEQPPQPGFISVIAPSWMKNTERQQQRLVTVAIKTDDVAAPWKQDRFAISFFAQTHTPPIDDASFQLMRDGNFTTVGLFDHLGANKPDTDKTALQQRLCEKYGLKCLLGLDNFKKAKNGSRTLPQLSSTQWGFYLADEPNAAEFPGLAKDVAAVRKEAPGSMSFINLLPSNVSGEGHGDNPAGWAHEWGASNYTAYAQQLVDVVKPDVVCFDHYPVFHSDPTVTGKTKCKYCRDTREDYIRNLEMAAAVAHPAHLPLWLYFNIVPYRRLFLGDPTEAQIRWQISVALAYGVTGLLYFEWHPMGDGHPGLVMSVDSPPVPSPHFFQAKRLNSWVLAMEPTLLHAVSKSTVNLRYEDQNVSYSALGVARSSGLRSISRGDWTLGFFDLPQSNVASAALLLVNNEHAYIEWATVEWQDAETVSEISGHSGQPVAVVDDAPDAPGFQLRLEPGQGRLFVFANATSGQARHKTDDGQAATAPPHIIFLLVDDLGWNNVPWNPLSVVKAPHAEALYKEGMSVPHAYVHRWCTPTRAALMTGRYAFRNGWNQYGAVGCNGKRCADGVCCPGQQGFAEELSSVPLAFEMMPAMLKRGGYKTHMLGKWHLGHYTQEHTPVGRGYDSFFGFLFGSETHDSHNSWGRHTCNVPVTDLFNNSQRANESVHYKNMTYSPEMYAMEMGRLIADHPSAANPFFLYMSFQNNHAPYTAVKLYTDRYPELKEGSMQRVYNSNMAAVDDTIGSMRESLRRAAPVFENRTLVVFSQDNGGPARMANNVPLRGAKFGVFEGGVRSNSFLWGPGVLPDGAAGKTYNGIFHLVDYYATFAHLAGVSTAGTGPKGFDSPDGVDQWAALTAVARGETTVTFPRTEVVLDMLLWGNLTSPIGKYVIALRSGDFKLIAGAVGETTVVADEPYTCSDCCPLKRPPLPPLPAKANICANVPRESRDEVQWPPLAAGPKAAYECSWETPCVFDVVNDVNESINLVDSPAHAATLAHLRERVEFHAGRIFDQDIDHTNVTAQQYCSIVKAGLWAEPFGFAPPGPPPPKPTPVPPPSPIAPALAKSLAGLWGMHPPPSTELFRIEVLNETHLEVSTVNHTNCWKEMIGTVEVGGTSSDATTTTIVLTGREAQCKKPPDEVIGTFLVENQKPQIKWSTWDPWTKYTSGQARHKTDDSQVAATPPHIVGSPLSTVGLLPLKMSIVGPRHRDDSS